MEEASAEEPRFRELTLFGFVERLASSEPVPGGGSASAVTGALGAALVAMVANLSDGRPRYARYGDLHARGAELGRRLADRFLALADEDAAAYGRFAAALKLPRDTDEQRATRSDALAAAARTAAGVPLSCVETCLELVGAAESLAGRSNQNASSDLSVASLLGEAAARGAAQNVLVNLPSIGDARMAEEMSSRVDHLLHDIERLAQLTRETVAAGTLR